MISWSSVPVGVLARIWEEILTEGKTAIKFSSCSVIRQWPNVGMQHLLFWISNSKVMTKLISRIRLWSFSFACAQRLLKIKELFKNSTSPELMRLIGFV